MNEEAIGKLTLDAAFAVHRELGPGLLESVYEAAMMIELRRLGLKPKNQVPIPISYQNEDLGVGFRADIVVNQLVLVELKSVESISPVFKKTTLNYLRLIPLHLGFLINFNEALLKNGITRIANDLTDSNTPRRVRRETYLRNQQSSTSPNLLVSRRARRVQPQIRNTKFSEHQRPPAGIVIHIQLIPANSSSPRRVRRETHSHEI